MVEDFLGLLVPLAGMHERVGPTDMPRHCKHQTEGVLGDGHGIGAWGVHDRDTLASRGVEIDVVHSHSRATDHAQLSSMLEQFCIYLNCRAHDEGVGVF